MPARYVSSRIVPWSRVRDQFGDQNVLSTFTSAVVGRGPSFLAAPRLAALSPRVSALGRETCTAVSPALPASIPFQYGRESKRCVAASHLSRCFFMSTYTRANGD